MRVQTLWVGAVLPPLERLCLQSFLAHGHQVHLYAYEEPSQLPAGVRLEDAAAILPRQRIFRYGAAAGAGEGSLAAFSNLFRYRLLRQRGGLWVDADVFCLRRDWAVGEYLFATEWARRGGLVAAIHTGVLRVPPNSPVMRLCDREAEARGVEELAWGEIGNALLERAVERLGLGRLAVEPAAFCPIPWWEMTAYARGERRFEPTVDGFAVHLYSEMWRRAGLDRLPRHPPGSILATLRRSLEI